MEKYVKLPFQRVEVCFQSLQFELWHSVWSFNVLQQLFILLVHIQFQNNRELLLLSLSFPLGLATIKWCLASSIDGQNHGKFCLGILFLPSNDSLLSSGLFQALVPAQLWHIYFKGRFWWMRFRWLRKYMYSVPPQQCQPLYTFYTLYIYIYLHLYTCLIHLFRLATPFGSWLPHSCRPSPCTSQPVKFSWLFNFF